MLTTTRAIVLRSVKYGETSLVCTMFTRNYGLEAYMIQGVRSSKSRGNKAGLLQPASLLEMLVYRKPQGGLQRPKEFQPSYIYSQLQEDIVRNSVALFSVELLLRLMPEQAPQPELFDLTETYFMALDQMPLIAIANFPLYFLMRISEALGYEIHGNYSEATPHLHLHEGAFMASPPMVTPIVEPEAAKALDSLRMITDIAATGTVMMNAQMRAHLLDWYLLFLQRHTQHLGAIRSLAVLQAVLH